MNRLVSSAAVLGLGVLLSLMFAAVAGEAPELVNYQGRLIGDGKLYSGRVTLTLELFDQPTAGTRLLAERHEVDVVDGFYTAHIGALSAPGELRQALDSREVWLEVSVGETVLTPRERLVSVPYALVAEQANGAADGAIQTRMLARQAVGNDQLADGAVDNRVLAGRSVREDTLDTGAVSADKLAPSSVTTSKLATAAVTTAKLADGSVTAAKLAKGAVEYGKIAENAVELGPDTLGSYLGGVVAGDGLSATAAPAEGGVPTLSVNVDNASLEVAADVLRVKNGAVGAPQLAKKYRSGSQAVTVRPGCETPVDVTFSPAFPTVPMVTASLNVSGASASSPYAYLRQKSVSNAVIAVGVSADAASPVTHFTNATHLSSVQMFSYPSACAYRNGTLQFGCTFSGDASAITWTTVSSGGIGEYPSQYPIGDKAAVCYYDGVNGDLKFALAGNYWGSTWPSKVTVDTGGAADVGKFTSLASVNGRPAISYFDDTNNQLLYTRASEATGVGGAWTTRVTVDTGVNLRGHTALRVVNGRPAVAYCPGSSVRYVRAANADGTAWGAPVGFGSSVRDVSMQVVDGRPAIAYVTDSGVYYRRADDADGTAWSAASVTLWMATGAAQEPDCSLVVVDGLPTVAFYDPLRKDLMLIRAADPQGSSWGAPARLDTDGDVGAGVSLGTMGSSLPVIAYQDAEGSTLKILALEPQAATLEWIAVEP